MAKTEQNQQALRDDDPRDDDDDGGGGTSAGFVTVVIALAVTILAIISAIGVIKSTQTTPPGVATCTSSCWGFARLECPGDRLMGTCFGVWGCGDPQTNHVCGKDN